MSVFESSIVINQPVNKVYQFLSDLNNHQQLMPDNIYNWSSTADEARFTIQNMAKLAVKIGSRIENQEITIMPAEEAPFAVQMIWTTQEQGEQTLAKLTVNAELNMMMKMLASGPLQKLVDHQTTALAKAFV